MAQASDAELMVRVRAGDRQAFGLIVDRYQHVIVNFLSRLTGRRDRAEDLAQETFLRFLLRHQNYQEQGKLKGFLFRMAANLAHSEHKKERRRAWLTLAFLSGENGSNGAGPSPQEQVIELEDQRKLGQPIYMGGDEKVDYVLNPAKLWGAAALPYSGNFAKPASYSGGSI